MTNLSIGDRVRLRVKKNNTYPTEHNFDGLTGTIEDLTGNPWFPVSVLIDGNERPSYFKESECEPIGEGDDV